MGLCRFYARGCSAYSLPAVAEVHLQEMLYKCTYPSGHAGLDHGKLLVGRWLGSNGEALCHIAYEYNKKARYAHHSMFASACPTAIIYAQDCQMRILAYRRPSVAV